MTFWFIDLVPVFSRVFLAGALLSCTLNFQDLRLARLGFPPSKLFARRWREFKTTGKY